MRLLSTALIVCAALSTTAGFAQAGVCTDQISQLRQAPQPSRDATSETMGQPQTYKQLMFSADVTRAEALDALGAEERCLLAARSAKLDLEN